MWLCRPLATSIDSDEPPRLSLCGAWRGYLHGPTPCWAPVAGPLEQQVQKGSGCQEGWSQPQGRHLNSWGLDRSRDTLQRLLGMQGLPSGQLCVGCSFFFPRPEWEPPSHHTEVMTWKQLGSWINWASGLAGPSDHSRDPRPDRRPRPCSPDPGARSCPQPDPRARPVPPNSRFSKAIFLNLHLSQVGSETQRPWGNGGQAPLAGPPRTLQSLGVVYPP